MPKVPKASFNFDDLTPFAREIVGYIREHWPMTVSEFATQIGRRPSVVWRWIKDDAIPQLDTVDDVAARTGISRNKLRAAAGYPLAGDARDVMEYLIAAADRTGYSREERERLTRFLQTALDEYERGEGSGETAGDKDSKDSGSHRTPATAAR